jgi:cellulose synthase/poly-beta-1,6-N-acetylglucosamine synthase-like glycosyltransferase
MMDLLFWAALGLTLFSLFGYGLLWMGLARLLPARPRFEPAPQDAVMLIAARNEAADIGAKIRSVLEQDTGAHRVSVLVVSDGSTDGTEAAALAAAAGDPRVRVLQLDSHGGKAAAMNRGLAEIAPEQVVIFSDANSLLRPGALARLLAPFGDPGVGGSVGQLAIPATGGLMAAAERLFWRYDNALKRAEDRVGGVVSAQGTLYAVRRALVPVVPGDMADDFAISVAVVDQGRRLAYAPGAEALETVTSDPRAEAGRRLRSTERGWRGLMHYRRLMNPARSGLYAVQLVCHKLLRRLVAFALPVLLVASVLTAGEGPVQVVVLAGQLLVYGLAAAALLWRPARRLPGASAAVLFTVGHLTIAYAILRYWAGVRTTKWAPVRAEG